MLEFTQENEILHNYSNFRIFQNQAKAQILSTAQCICKLDRHNIQYLQKKGDMTNMRTRNMGEKKCFYKSKFSNVAIPKQFGIVL